MTWIKICGTTNLEDAQMCVEAGADALGFIFAESPRKIDNTTAAKIVSLLPPTVEKIAVVQNQPLEPVEATVKVAKLTLVQLHGHEDSNYVETLFRDLATRVVIANPQLRIRKARERLGGSGIELGPNHAIFALLYDSTLFGKSGGTGVSWNWKKEATSFREFAERGTRAIVAGGLTPENVGEAIRILRPWGVDVVTGVEREPGKKDPKKVKAFIEAVRRADEGLTAR